MKNIERLTKYITKNGGKDLLIHVIPGTSNWLICQKIEEDKWALTLGNPMGNVTYNVGTVSNDQHLALWMELTKIEIDRKANLIRAAEETRQQIKHFLASKRNYNFLKKYEENNHQNQNNKSTKKSYPRWET